METIMETIMETNVKQKKIGNEKTCVKIDSLNLL
jgi:hypothetical protein